MDKERAIRATRAGAIAACISGSITTIVYLVAAISGSSGSDTLAYYNDPLIIVDIGMIFLLAWFIYKNSRIAAIFMFLYFLISKIYLAFGQGQVSGIFVGAIFLFYFGRAVWGAFSFHKIEKTENPNYGKKRRWVWWLLGPIVLIFLGLFGVGLMTMTGFMPSTEVQAGNKVNERHIQKLINADIISDQNDIKYFYSGGFSSVLEEGVFFSDEKFTMYYTDLNGELQIYELPIEQITKVEQISEGSFVEDALYKVSTEDPDAWINFTLSIENDGHIKFVETLKENIGSEKH